MRTLRCYLCLLLTITLGGLLVAQSNTHIMVVTGGHGFDRGAFFGMFDAFEDVTYEEVEQPLANEQIESGLLDAFDIIIFYDMYDSITEGQKAAYLKLVSEKKPMLFLHHSIVSYQQWPTFREIVGGKYNSADTSHQSDYKHDQNIDVQVLDKDHYITNGMADFTLFDETYRNCEILPEVHPLLGTDHPLSMPLIGWVNTYNDHQMVYLQSGHGPQSFVDKNFTRILRRAVAWSVRGEKEPSK